ncbi:MAG: GLPGLI family protein [Bacteroidales bacterium]|nr:GLPGLI family protein [Bacteroidales bacterium]
MAVCLLMALAAMAQNRGYTCSYQFQMKLDESLLELDAQVKEAVMQQMANMKTVYSLTYFNGRSLFEIDEERSDNAYASMAGHSVFVDYDKKQMVKQETFFGRKFLIEEPLEAIDWKIDNAESRVIDGHTCYKAVADGQEAGVVAWFTPEIPIPAGPMGYFGLPGLIVELDMANAILKMEDISAKDNAKELKAPSKGKRVTQAEYEKIMDETVQQFRDGSGGGNVQIMQLH